MTQSVHERSWRGCQGRLCKCAVCICLLGTTQGHTGTPKVVSSGANWGRWSFAAMQPYCPCYHASSLKTSLVALQGIGWCSTSGPWWPQSDWTSKEGTFKRLGTSCRWWGAWGVPPPVRKVLFSPGRLSLGRGEEWKCCLPKSCAERSSFCSCWALRERLSDKSHWGRERGFSLGGCVGCQYIYWPPSACPFPPWLALVPLQVVACRSFVRLWWLLGCDSCWWRAT